MNKVIVLTSAILAIMLSPSIASAQADSEYPAANFEPKVVFIDEAAANSTKASAQSSSQGSQQAEVDPKHPAAFFQPKIIFP